MVTCDLRVGFRPHVMEAAASSVSAGKGRDSDLVQLQDLIVAEHVLWNLHVEEKAC